MWGVAAIQQSLAAEGEGGRSQTQKVMQQNTRIVVITLEVGSSAGDELPVLGSPG